MVVVGVGGGAGAGVGVAVGVTIFGARGFYKEHYTAEATATLAVRGFSGRGLGDAGA